MLRARLKVKASRSSRTANADPSLLAKFRLCNSRHLSYLLNLATFAGRKRDAEKIESSLL